MFLLCYLRGENKNTVQYITKNYYILERGLV